jgi:hypothetical protein
MTVCVHIRGTGVVLQVLRNSDNPAGNEVNILSKLYGINYDIYVCVCVCVCVSIYIA